MAGKALTPALPVKGRLENIDAALLQIGGKTFLRCTTAVDRHLRIPFFFVIIGLPKRPTAFPEQR